MEAEKLRTKNQNYLPGNEIFEKWLSQKIVEERSKLVPFGTKEAGEPDKVAVVVHVIHNGENYGVGVNITNEQIYSQIEVLNEDFRRMNGDTLDTQSEFLPLASKLNIEFVLARQDENGNPTTGIIRKVGTKSSYNISVADRTLLSNISQWDPSIYLNIWVTDLAGQNIGLAQFPDFGESQDPNGLPGLDDKDNKANPVTDGLVIDYQAFGSVDKVPGLDLKSQYDLGRSATHEIGHFFGLLHVWGDGGCFVDDYVEDTPNSNTDYLGDCVPAVHLSCNSNDMFENYMYYTDDACMNIFSTGQVGRMDIILQYAPRRASLLNSIGTEYPENLSFDLAIASVLSPGKVLCEVNIIPAIEVKNNGGSAVGEFSIILTINDIDYDYSYTGDSIRSGETVELEFGDFQLTDGSHHITFELTNILSDVEPSNNSATHVFAIDNQEDFIPLREKFDVENIDDTNWITLNEDEDIGWEIAETDFGTTSNPSAFINLFNYEDRRQIDWLVSPILDFSNAVEASLKFKASYARNTGFNDQLQVVASEDCESFFDTVLKTFTVTDLAVTNSGDYWEPESLADWKEHSIDLTDFAGKNNIRLAFKSINDYGNNLYLDDVEFYTTAEDKIVTVAQNSFTLYPNPAIDGRFQLAFNTSGRQEVAVHIYDELGREVVVGEFPNTLNQTYYYNLQSQPAGIYFVHVVGKDFIRSKKLLVTH
jgi:hypothetical protein